MRLIDADELKKTLGITNEDCSKCGWGSYESCGRGYDFEDACVAIDNAVTINAVPVIRCKDCKHKPTGMSRDDLEFPDDKCPCKCEDYWYSWKPSDNWFCGNGERKDGSENARRI